MQVKRTQGTINRPIIDQLRGALPYHNAIKGMIITLGKFAANCSTYALHLNAAPITLIDGNELIRLAVEHQVGIKVGKIDLMEIDEAQFRLGLPPNGVESISDEIEDVLEDE